MSLKLTVQGWDTGGRVLASCRRDYRQEARDNSMSTLNVQGISLSYETHGDPEAPPVLLVSGLGGVGASWGTQIARFTEKYHVILPDQRGTGRTTRALDGHTTRQLAADMASLVEELVVGPVHVVGASTGGAIAQYMALEHPRLVRSLTLSSTFARFDAFTRREFEVRRRLAAEWDRRDLLSAYALFLFGPRYAREHPEAVVEWIDRAAALPAHPDDRRIGLARIDMIAAHDTFARLREIAQPTLVLCGEHNFCTPLPLSEELVRGIPDATLIVFEDAGELIELEQPVRFFTEVSGFIDGLCDPARG
ncbi:alpha/beta hydrolase [Streptomyces yokosukanensis]|uniref:alpha/beta fold hydrolase n=1 Tax=Streptomyces yokosukanensis TaxID=67386 RepID=UPI00342243BA